MITGSVGTIWWNWLTITGIILIIGGFCNINLDFVLLKIVDLFYDIEERGDVVVVDGDDDEGLVDE